MSALQPAGTECLADQPPSRPRRVVCHRQPGQKSLRCFPTRTRTHTGEPGWLTAAYAQPTGPVSGLMLLVALAYLLLLSGRLLDAERSASRPLAIIRLEGTGANPDLPCRDGRSRD